MDITKLKEQLIAERAVHAAEVAAAKDSIKRLEAELAKITAEDYEKMAGLGYSIDFLRSIDVQKLEKDREYAEYLKEEVSASLDRLVKKLEVEVNA